MTCEQAVLGLLRQRSQRAREVWAALLPKGFSEPEVRTAIARLWDTGQLNVGLDQRLTPT